MVHDETRCVCRFNAVPGECVVKFDITARISAEEFWNFRSEISEVVRELLRKLPVIKRSELQTKCSMQ